MPITLGPQASCSSRYPRYGKNIDPTIIPTTTDTYSAARAQARAEAKKAVATATQLGIVRGSTIFYDLEAFNTSQSTACRNSALWYLSAWTTQLHSLGYASGYYSSAASGIKMVDDQRVAPHSPLTLPDQVWIADWNNQANTSSSYVRSDGWQPYNRMKQYRGGHNETWGGVTINIDRDYLKLRTPRIPGSSAPAPAPAPTPKAPKYTGSSTSDARCMPSTITRRDYPTVTSAASAYYVVPLQCLLKQQHLYKYEVTGKWNTQTQAALSSFQAGIGVTKSSTITRPVWTALVSRGNSRTLLHLGMKGADAVRVQRAMNASIARRLAVSGTYRPATKRAVKAYQRAVHIAVTGTVTPATWAALERGRR
jgi:peptidoglycan hydrolase-like protein with peptidoglycan-binding domain